MAGKYRSIKGRSIVLGGKKRLYSVSEFPEIVKVRCYGVSKSSYLEATFKWPALWAVNHYKPSTIALLYDYACAHGWEPEREKSVFTFTGEDALPKDLTE